MNQSANKHRIEGWIAQSLAVLMLASLLFVAVPVKVFAETEPPVSVCTEKESDDTYISLKRTVTAKLVWIGGSTPRPTVWFRLYRETDSDITELPPSAESPFGYLVMSTEMKEFSGAALRELPDGTDEAIWENIESTDEHGNAYTYLVLQVDANGDRFTPENYEKDEDGMTVTNTYIDSSPGEERIAGAQYKKDPESDDTAILRLVPMTGEVPIHLLLGILMIALGAFVILSRQRVYFQE